MANNTELRKHFRDFRKYISKLRLETVIDYSIPEIRKSYNPAYNYIIDRTDIDGIISLTPYQTDLHGICTLDDYDYHDFITAFYLPETVYHCKIQGFHNILINKCILDDTVSIDDILRECKSLPDRLDMYTTDSYIHTPTCNNREIYLDGIRYIRHVFFAPCLPICCLHDEMYSVLLDTSAKFYIETINLTLNSRHSFMEYFERLGAKYSRYYLLAISIEDDGQPLVKCDGRINYGDETLFIDKDPKYMSYINIPMVGWSSINYIKPL